MSKGFTKISKISLALGLLAAMSAAPVLAQSTQPSADALMEKAIAAGGGTDAMKKVKTRTVTGKFSLPANNLNGTLRMLQKDNVGVVLIDIPGIGKVARGFDGKTAWEQNPMQGARILSGAESEELARQFNVMADIDWKKTYEKVEVVGDELVEGKKAYKVVFTTKVGSSETRFYDADSYLVTKTVSSVESPMGKMEMETIMSDYKDQDGIKIPMKMVGTMAGQQQVIEFEKVEQNTEILASEFAVPAEVQALIDAKAKEAKP